MYLGIYYVCTCTVQVQYLFVCLTTFFEKNVALLDWLIDLLIDWSMWSEAKRSKIEEAEKKEKNEDEDENGDKDGGWGKNDFVTTAD